MKNVLFSVGFLLISFTASIAQAQTNSLPYSFINNQLVPSIPTTNLDKPQVDALIAEDNLREKQGLFYRTGVMVKPTEELNENSGKWIDNQDGTSSWFLQVKSDDAKALGFYFDYFSLPQGSKLYAYNQDKTHIVGPYTSENSADKDLFAAAPVIGNVVTLEYNGPSESIAEFKVTINEVAYMYRNGGFGPKDAGEFGDSEACQVNANCPEGASWDAQRRSVVKIIVRDGNFSGLCSGAMINSANTDCTPYILTANHCGGGATQANFKQWIFYFNFETPGCSNPASATNLDDQTVTGCLKMSNSSDISDVVASDFLLVHLKNRPATSFNAFFAGWSRSATAASSGVSIHHPAGDVKKISTYTTTLTNSGWSGSNTGKHWGVRWASTASGYGVTEGGSSGSPIFDQIGRIVGDLSGGSSFCASPTGQDVYGKFAYSWDQTGTTANRRLKDWLDKTNLNPSAINGKESISCISAALPVVEFIANNTTPLVNQTVNLTNQSTGSAFGYEWLITPNTHTYVNGTTHLSENPQVQFGTTVSYSVNLHVYNSAGYQVRTRTAYIKPTNILSVDELDLQQPILFPNPSADGNFQILSGGNKPIENVNITDLSGKTVYSWVGKNAQVSINNLGLSKGVYLVKIGIGQKTNTEKLIIY